MQFIGIILMITGTLFLIGSILLAYKNNYSNKRRELMLIEKSGHAEKHTAPEQKENIYRKEAIKAIKRPRSMDEESRKILDEVENDASRGSYGSEKVYSESDSYSEIKEDLSENTDSNSPAVEDNTPPKHHSVHDSMRTAILLEKERAENNGTSILPENESNEDSHHTAILPDDIAEQDSAKKPSDPQTAVLNEEEADQPASHHTAVLEEFEEEQDKSHHTAILPDDAEESSGGNNYHTAVLDDISDSTAVLEDDGIDET